MTGPVRSLINADGSSFNDELPELRVALAALPNPDRMVYRDQNALDVARHEATRILVVAGPGSGKTFLFLERIKYWLSLDEHSEIYVATFVRKLVTDLQHDIRESLATTDQRRVTVTSLHQLARSFIERNHGTSTHRFRAHVGVIAWPWVDLVWADVLQFRNDLNRSNYPIDDLETQFHTGKYRSEPEWVDLLRLYSELRRLYNAVGFADMIVLAREAVEENPELIRHVLWIVDEYQDFNAAEDQLVREVTHSAVGVLVAGDDEQALYLQLKASHPEIIISYYSGTEFANAMLPYCSRSSYHVCQVASSFIEKHRTASSIGKVYLPLTVNLSDQKIRIVGTATPSGAVDFIAKFLEDHKVELDAHVAKFQSGEETEPFLLILSPDRTARYYALDKADENLLALVARWAAQKSGHGFDYRRIATYCAAAWDASDNFALRKVLEYEKVPPEEVHPILTAALNDDCFLSQVDSDLISGAVLKSKNVAFIIGGDSLVSSDKVARLAALVEVDDPDRLMHELAQDPIGTATVSSEAELAAAHPTADKLSPVELMSMIGAKGLSAKHVIIIGCDNVNMSRTTPLTFFVALTRARRSLQIITALKARGKGPHSFLGDLPDDNCEYYWYKKSTRDAERLASFAAYVQKFGQLARMAAKFKKP